jgi:hypothetical protein
VTKLPFKTIRWTPALRAVGASPRTWRVTGLAPDALTKDAAKLRLTPEPRLDLREGRGEIVPTPEPPHSWGG